MTYLCGQFFKKSKHAGVVKLVDTPDLGSGAARCGGSSPSTRTTLQLFLPYDIYCDSFIFKFILSLLKIAVAILSWYKESIVRFKKFIVN